jgi:RNA polymerase sigma-70 factor (ECF subfamily)
VDPEIIRRAKEGDWEAREQIFRHYQRPLYNYILRSVNNEEEAADITQDVFVRLFETLHTLRAEEALTSFLYTIATNACRDHARRRQRVQFESLDAPRPSSNNEESGTLDIPDSADTPDVALEREELQNRVQQAIESLSPDHRAVIVMHHLQDMEVNDIARILGTRVGTVKSRLARARAELARKLGGYIKG